MQGENQSEAGKNSPEVVELRVLIARLEGQLDKTPGRFEFFAHTLSIVGLLTAVFAAIFFFVVQSNQRAFKADVLEIIETREAAAMRRITDLWQTQKGLKPFLEEDQ